MKKNFYLLLIALCVIAYMKRKVLSDTGDASSDSKKVKYIIESAWRCTYENGEVVSGAVNKTIYERGKETKYLKSYSQYEGDRLLSRLTYQNEPDRDYHWLSYPSGRENDKDTTIWYDEYRVKEKEYRSKSTRYVYEYAGRHNNRVTTYKSWYRPSEQICSESHYTYNCLTRNGETKYYDLQGKLSSRQTSIVKFRDNTFDDYDTWETETFDSEGKKESSFIEKCEWTGNLCTKSERNTNLYNSSGEVYDTYRCVSTYDWQDELNNTFVYESYTRDSLLFRQEGYYKYKY